MTWSIFSTVSPASLTAWPATRVDEVARELVELRPRELDVEVLRPIGRCGDERQVDLGLLHGRELDLRLLRRLLQALRGHLVARKVDALGVLELRDEPLHDLVVPVVPAELGVPRGRLDLEHALCDVEDRDVEGAATEVEDQDGLLGSLFVEAVREGRGRRLVHDPQDLEAGDLASLFGGGALRIVEVRRHSDHGLVHGVAEVRLGVTPQLAEDASGDLLGGVLLPVDVDGPGRAHVALHGADGAIWVGDGLALGDLADEHLAGLGEADDRRGRPRAFGVRDDDGLSRFEDADDRVRGPEVDSYCFCHRGLLLLRPPLTGRPSGSHRAPVCTSKCSKLDMEPVKFSSSVELSAVIIPDQRASLRECPARLRATRRARSPGRRSVLTDATAREACASFEPSWVRQGRPPGRAGLGWPPESGAK